MNIPQSYIQKIRQRSWRQYLKGLFIRLLFYMRSFFCRRWAIMKGAKIGEGTVLSWNIARMASSNLVVGDDCIINARYLDLREKITIRDRVIINRDVEIIRVSHYIDDDHLFTTRPYPELIIEEYSWLSTGVKVLPRVTKISRGTICGAYSVIVKNTEEMGVYGGNPAKLLKTHNTVFDELIVCSLQGCDFPYYRKARSNNNNSI